MTWYFVTCLTFNITGFAGSDAKVKYLKSLGFDAAYNYKTISSLDETIKEACPNGVDLFFDLVRNKKHNYYCKHKLLLSPRVI